LQESAGTRVGPFVLLERLGSGGMGEVYLGEDTRLDRKVALKCLLASRQEAGQHSRIIHEARAAAQINHPNVATIHDVIDQGTRAFIVMEYVEGESLAARLRRGRVPVREVLAIGRQLAAALIAAHGVGVVHRDLKPANIQLGRGGVKVLDFGIARAPVALAGPSSPTRSDEETQPHGPRAGTPAYMAPEQIVGRAVDHRADLYSLGVVLFELCAGRRPYEYVDPLELIRMPESLAPPVTEVDSGVPPALAAVVALLLKCDPDRRYQSAQQLDEALAAVERDLGAVRRPTRREWIALSVAGAAGVAAFAWRQYTAALPVRPIRSIAVLPFVNLSGNPAQEYFVDGLTDGLINALGRIGALSVKARTSVMAFKGSTKGIAQIARELKVDAIIEGSAMLTSNGAESVRVSVNLIDPSTQTQLWSAALERSVRGVLAIYAELARSIAEQIGVRLTPDEQRRVAAAPAVDPETFKIYLLGRQEWNGRTEPQLRRALKYFAEASARSPDYAPAYSGQADAYVLLTGDFGAYTPAHGAAQTVAMASRALSLDPELAEAYTSLAFANFFLLWDFEAAGQQFRKALELNPSYATAHHWYGNFLSDMGREDEALTAIRRALDLDPFSAIISRDVAWPLFFGRRYDEAIAHLDATLVSFPDYLPAQRLRARALAQRGEAETAVLEFQRQKARSDSPRARFELAWALALSDRRDEAAAELKAALQVQGARHPYDLALVHAALGARDDAFAALQRAFDERDSTMVNLRHDPRFDSLRTDDRFGRLVAQMRFPPL
jgi:serine/threonine-protein kinase